MFLDFISINIWSILISVANLLLLFFILKMILFKPIQKIFAERAEQVDTLYSQANNAKDKAEADRVLYAQKLEQADMEAAQILRTATQKADLVSEEIVAEANKKAALAMEKADAEIAQSRKKAINEIKDEISAISVEIAEQIVSREINEKDHKELIDSFIDGIGDGNA